MSEISFLTVALQAGASVCNGCIGILLDDLWQHQRQRRVYGPAFLAERATQNSRGSIMAHSTVVKKNSSPSIYRGYASATLILRYPAMSRATWTCSRPNSR